MAKKENLYKRFPILDIEWVRNELLETIEGFELKDLSVINKKAFNCYYLNNNQEEIKLEIKANGIVIKKSGNLVAETTIIPDSSNLIKNTLEKRDKGIIVENIHKRYASSKRFEEQKVLVDLWSKRYVISYISLGAFLNFKRVENAKPEEIFSKLALFTNHNHLQSIAILVTDFSTHMDYVNSNISSKNIALNEYSDKTYVNNSELSCYHHLTDGFDKLIRIYDLYRGIINKKNLADIDDIHYGLVDCEAFDTKTFLGITQKENNFVGFNNTNDKYLSYLEGYLRSKYNYPGIITLDRENIIRAIMYKYTFSEALIEELIKKYNMTYDEYLNLSDIEKEELIRDLPTLKK